MGFGRLEGALRLIQEKGWAKVKSLDSRPTMLPESEVYWNAWKQLHQCRRGNDPLSVSDIHAWMLIHEVVDVQDFFYILLEVDAEWLDWAHKEHGNTTRSD